MTSESLRFEPRSLDDPVTAALIAAYVLEMTRSIPGFDPAMAAAPGPSDFDPPAGVFLVAFEGDAPIGIGGLRQFASGVGEIRRMWVAPEARGRGHARRILDELEQAARTAGYSEMLLDTADTLAAALALYRGSGYVERSRYNDNPFADHFFEKRLT